MLLVDLLGDLFLLLNLSIKNAIKFKMLIIALRGQVMKMVSKSLIFY